MAKKRLVYVWSLRNAAADQAGKYVTYKNEQRYMTSPLEHLVVQLNEADLGELYSLEAIIHDDDECYEKDKEKLGSYSMMSPVDGGDWFFPLDMSVQGNRAIKLMESIASSYRSLPIGSPERPAGKHKFENSLLNRLIELEADVVMLDGLIVILDELIRPGSLFHRKVVNIHPGITRVESPYERRGASATLDALYRAQGKRVINWKNMETEPVLPLYKTGASFHYVDNGVDSGEVIIDALNTDISPDDTILELRWNNFQLSSAYF
jgi:folate-dependent phosphoribosylglycinamide formyltransferase PurN